MRIFKKVGKIAVQVILWSVLALSVILMIATVAVRAGGKSPTIFGIGLYHIVSGSMEPEIKVGDIIIGKNAEPEDVKVGDNIIFNFNNMLVVHKVIEIRENSFITHGIANPEGSNENVKHSDLIARQVGRLAGFGILLDGLRSPFGFILAVIVPISGLIIYQTVILSKKLKEYKGEKKSLATEQTEALKEEIAELKSTLKKHEEPEETE